MDQEYRSQRNRTVTKQVVPDWEQRSASTPVQSLAMPESHESVTLSDSQRLAYSVEETAQLLGVHHFSVYRMIQRGRLRACRVLRGKLLVPRAEILKLLKME